MNQALPTETGIGAKPKRVRVGANRPIQLIIHTGQTPRSETIKQIRQAGIPEDARVRVQSWREGGAPNQEGVIVAWWKANHSFEIRHIDLTELEGSKTPPGGSQPAASARADDN